MWGAVGAYIYTSIITVQRSLTSHGHGYIWMTQVNITCSFTFSQYIKWWAHLTSRVDQLQVVLLPVHRHHLGERWQTTHKLRVVKLQQSWCQLKSNNWQTGTHCSLWWGHRSRQTGPPQTGWWETTFLETNELLMNHQVSSFTVVALKWFIPHDITLKIIM